MPSPRSAREQRSVRPPRRAFREGNVRITAVVRARLHRHAPVPRMVLEAEDRVLLEGEAEDLESLVARAKLDLVGERQPVPAEAAQVVEGVVTEASPLV